MASVATLPSRARAEHRELTESMEKVREELDKVRSAPDPDNVHDLRVAIRRCRSVATVFEEVDPDPAWPELRRSSKRLFRALGALRDAHIIDDWVKKLTPATDAVRVHMHSLFESEEPQLRNELLRVAGKFDGKSWKRLQRRLRQRVHFIPVGGLAAECLAWERFEDIKQLHALALRSRKAKPWHALRIGLKRFRYTVESLLPVHHAAWSENLKRLQDLLGDIHDLDVIADKIKTQPAIAAGPRKAWKQTVQHERNKRVQTYRHLTLGKTSIWNRWRHALPHGERLEAASFARLQATARASHSRPRRATRVARLSLRIFDLLRRAKAAPIFSDANMRRILRAAALLHAIGRDQKRKQPSKAARKMLLGMQIPPRWARDDWELLAWTVRFHRGAEPRAGDSKFGKLTAMEQENIRALAGVVRLGRVLHKAGIETAAGFKMENSAEAIALVVPNLPDSLKIAAKLAAGKHLLETALGRALLLKTTEKIAPVIAPDAAPQEVLQAMAAASD